MVRAVVLLVVAGALTILAGCDNPITCPDPCPNPKHSRDFFCSCYDPSENKAGKAPSQPEASPASCVCQYSSGLVGAFFSYQPRDFGKMGNTRVSAAGCSDLTLCEQIKTQTGVKYTYYTGLMSIKPENWVKEQSFITGGTIWYVLGKLQPMKAEAGSATGLGHLHRLASLYTRARRDLHQAKFLNDAPGCAAACASNSPYCFSQEISGTESQGLRKLHAALVRRPEVLPADSLRSMFGLKEDLCKRADSVISDGRLVNRGLSCKMVGKIAKLGVSAAITVPSVLDGAFSIENGQIIVRFDEPMMRPRLAFSDQYLNADWGGDIASVYGGNNWLGFSIGDQSCLRFSLK